MSEAVRKAASGGRWDRPESHRMLGRLREGDTVAVWTFEHAVIRERTSAGVAAARADGRISGQRKKLDLGKRREIAESVIAGRQSGFELARLYNITQPTVSRIVIQYRTSDP